MYIIEKNKNTNMKQNRIRLTESQLHRVIKESVNKVLKESNDAQDIDLWCKEDILELGYTYLGATKITNKKMIDTDYGDIPYILTDEGKTLRLYFQTIDEVDSLAKSLYRQGPYKLYTRHDIQTNMGYFLDIRFDD